MTGDIADKLSSHKGGMSVNEVSAIIGIRPSTLYEMARENRIPAVKIGAKVIFDPAKIAAWWRSKEAA